MVFRKNWFVVITKPRMERDACEHLVHQGFEAYLPFWVNLKKQRGAWQLVQSPMFPQYLFVRPSSPEQSSAPIRSTRGVSQLVRFGSEPALASDLLVNEIRRLEQDRNETGQTLAPFKIR